MTADASGTLVRQTCEFCGAAVSTLRRGRCWGCYQKWQEAQPVGRGASCVICGERRLDNLQRVELFGRWLPMCHICAVRTRRLQPTPADVEGIRAALRRERRRRERRSGKPDDRLDAKERRVADRRAIPVEEADIVAVEPLTDEERTLLAELALELTYDVPQGEVTRIRSRHEVLPPPPPGDRRPTLPPPPCLAAEATAIYEPLDEQDLLVLESADLLPPPKER